MKALILASLMQNRPSTTRLASNQAGWFFGVFKHSEDGSPIAPLGLTDLISLVMREARLQPNSEPCALDGSWRHWGGGMRADCDCIPYTVYCILYTVYTVACGIL